MTPYFGKRQGSANLDMMVLLQRTPDITHLDVDRLELCVIVDRRRSVLTAEPGPLVAAERHLARRYVVVVYAQRAGFDGCRDAVGARQVSEKARSIVGRRTRYQLR